MLPARHDDDDDDISNSNNLSKIYFQPNKEFFTGLVSLFNGTSTFAGFLMPKPFS